MGRLPKLQTLWLAHNRIVKLPQNIHHIKNLKLEDQVPLASFGEFSTEFAARWNESFQQEPGAGYLEMWMARFEEILRRLAPEKYCQIFKQRIKTLLDAMINNPDFRQLCYGKVRDVISVCYDGILFCLYELEVKMVEQRIIELQISDEEVRQEVDRAYSFYRLQELAILRAQKSSYKNNATPDEEKVDALETELFFYISAENTLEMTLNHETPRFMCDPQMAFADHDDVRIAVKEIRREKEECDPDYLINFVSDKEYWITYLSRRYANFITEHTLVFVDAMEEIEAKKDKIREYDYLTQMNALLVEKNQSEQKLFYQLAKNILVDRL